jgi:predicted GH43/DUF377 family glycosyl hydrolase
MVSKKVKKSFLRTGLVLSVILVILAAIIFTTVKAALAFSPQLTGWVQYPANPVFDPAESVYYPSIIFDGSAYHMWSDFGTGTQLANSTNGISWTPNTTVNGLTNGRHPVVSQVGAGYRIWYWNSTQLYSISAIRTATSADGITWTSDTAISQVGLTVITGAGVGWNRGSYGPCEVFYNPAGSVTITAPVNAATVWANKFVMYYDGTTGGLEAIGLAVSADGITWQGYNNGAAPVLANSGSGWDSDYATMGSIVKISGAYHMWYSGGVLASNEGIGYAQSTDGITWTKYGANPIMHKTDGVPWRADRTYTPRVLYNSANFSGAGENYPLKMWYNGTAGANYVLGYARMTVPVVPTPGGPVSIGGTVNPADKTAILMPYITASLAGAAVIIYSWFTWRRRALVRENNRKR